MRIDFTGWVMSLFSYCAAFLVLTGIPTSSHGPPVETRKSICTAPSYRQFDFWVGDWDAFEADHSAAPADAG